MALPRRTKLRMVTVIYWLLLFYMVAALIWWFIVLEKQNREMHTLTYSVIEKRTDVSSDERARMRDEIDRITSRNSRKYLSEGITFLILILIGAAFVYRSVRRQLLFQQQQQNFMMAVTHELKTPISVTRLNLETLQKYHLDEEKQRKIIHTTIKEIARLNTLTNNILISSQIEGGYSSEKEELDLSTLYRDCVSDYRTRYPDRLFVEEIETDVEVTGDALLLQLMINNLLENAVKYSPREKPVICRLVKRNDSTLLSILDEGPGIPETEKKKIFDKFYRIGSESTRTTQGTGLGLYLCRKIAEDHNADITVTNNIPTGSIFTFRF